jgi:hypothetical protein
MPKQINHTLESLTYDLNEPGFRSRPRRYRAKYGDAGAPNAFYSDLTAKIAAGMMPAASLTKNNNIMASIPSMRKGSIARKVASAIVKKYGEDSTLTQELLNRIAQIAGNAPSKVAAGIRELYKYASPAAAFALRGIIQTAKIAGSGAKGAAKWAYDISPTVIGGAKSTARGAGRAAKWAYNDVSPMAVSGVKSTARSVGKAAKWAYDVSPTVISGAKSTARGAGRTAKWTYKNAIAPGSRAANEYVLSPSAKYVGGHIKKALKYMEMETGEDDESARKDQDIPDNEETREHEDQKMPEEDGLDNEDIEVRRPVRRRPASRKRRAGRKSPKLAFV